MLSLNRSRWSSSFNLMLVLVGIGLHPAELYASESSLVPTQIEKKIAQILDQHRLSTDSEILIQFSKEAGSVDAQCRVDDNHIRQALELRVHPRLGISTCDLTLGLSARLNPDLIEELNHRWLTSKGRILVGLANWLEKVLVALDSPVIEEGHFDQWKAEYLSLIKSNGLKPEETQNQWIVGLLFLFAAFSLLEVLVNASRKETTYSELGIQFFNPVVLKLKLRIWQFRNKLHGRGKSTHAVARTYGSW